MYCSRKNLIKVKIFPPVTPVTSRKNGERKSLMEEWQSIATSSSCSRHENSRRQRQQMVNWKPGKNSNWSLTAATCVHREISRKNNINFLSLPNLPKASNDPRASKYPKLKGSLPPQLTITILLPPGDGMDGLLTARKGRSQYNGTRTVGTGRETVPITQNSNICNMTAK